MAKVRHGRSPGRPFLPLVRGGALLPFIGFLETAGAPVERYLAAARMSPQVPENAEGLVPLRQVLEFMDRAANDEGVGSFGLSVGERTEIDQLGTLGRVLRRSVTVWDAIASSVAHIQQYNSAERIWLRSEGDRVLLCHGLDIADAAGIRHGNLFAIMLLIKMIRLATGPKWWPREIRLPASETRWSALYEAVLATNLSIHAQPVYAIVLDRPLLAESLINGGEPGSVGTGDAAFLRATAPATDLVGSVRQAIVGLMSGGYPDVRLVAEAAGLGLRTFTRRLAEEGTSYGRLVEQARFEAAVALLRGDELRLIDIAYELGYSDPANFTRAFKRWAGMPPNEYRRGRHRRAGLVEPQGSDVA